MPPVSPEVGVSRPGDAPRGSPLRATRVAGSQGGPGPGEDGRIGPARGAPLPKVVLTTFRVMLGFHSGAQTFGGEGAPAEGAIYHRSH
eukprot:11108804-Alexandrium_andersonii.AAC.1